MCYCEKPTINGEMGYRWQPTDKPSVRKPHLPEMQNSDELLHDEPGRCGGVDCHSHDFRVVRQGRHLYLLVQHGGGAERIELSDYAKSLAATLAVLDSNARYWLLYAIYSACDKSARDAASKESAKWHKAATQKRIKVRKLRGRDGVKVSIEPEVVRHVSH